jgi:hypothetical protein
LERERPQWAINIRSHFDDHAAIDEGPDGKIYAASKGRGDEWVMQVFTRNAGLARSVAIVGLADVYDLHVRDDEVVFLAGTNRSGKPAIARLDADDEVRWAFSLDYVQPFFSISALADGTIVAGGLRVVLVDPETGAVLSQRNQSERGSINGLEPASDGGYWATTTTDDNSLAPNFQSLIKVGPDGVAEFGKVVEVDGGLGEGVAVLTDGSVVVAGGRSGECLVSRFSESASLLWSRLVGPAESFGCEAVTGTADGGVVVGGGLGRVDPEAMLVKLTADGTLVWSRNYGFAGFVQDVLEGTDGALIAQSPFPGSNVIRTDAEGRTGCESDGAIALGDPAAQARDVLFDVSNEKVVVIETPTVVQNASDVNEVCGFE